MSQSSFFPKTIHNFLYYEPYKTKKIKTKIKVFRKPLKTILCRIWLFKNLCFFCILSTRLWNFREIPKEENFKYRQKNPLLSINIFLKLVVNQSITGMELSSSVFSHEKEKLHMQKIIQVKNQPLLLNILSPLMTSLWLRENSYTLTLDRRRINEIRNVQKKQNWYWIPYKDKRKVQRCYAIRRMSFSYLLPSKCSSNYQLTIIMSIRYFGLQYEDFHGIEEWILLKENRRKHKLKIYRFRLRNKIVEESIVWTGHSTSNLMTKLYRALSLCFGWAIIWGC